MYIPNHFRNTDAVEMILFMRAHPFALIVNNGALVPQATHLPFACDERDGRLFLLSHFARGNPQWQSLKEGSEALVIFQGPHAYISPAHYEHRQNVPTWNFVAVHARGMIRLLHEEKHARTVLEKMIAAYEPAYREQFDGLSGDYISGMIKGIVAFELDVLQLEGKYKLSQNKTEREQQNIIDSLGQSDDGAARETAQYMQRNKKQ